MIVKGSRNIDYIYFLEYNDKLFKYIFPFKKNVDFSKYKLTNIGLYSITHKDNADNIAKILRLYINNDKPIITDATGNMGGDTLAFSNYFYKVNSFEINKKNCMALKNNVKNYRAKNVKIYCNDYLTLYDKINQDIIYFDPPWGGPSYKDIKNLDLYINNINIIDIVKKLLNKTDYIAIKAPFNFNFKKLKNLNKKYNIHKMYKKNGKFNFFLIVIFNYNI